LKILRGIIDVLCSSKRGRMRLEEEGKIGRYNLAT
jgi:hypothetical protein